jgi:hypothetical protein
MSLPNTISAGQTISASPVQANFSDISSEITGSLPRDGQAAMTGQLKASSGTVAAPGISFSSDTDTGFYRKTGDTIGVVAGGSEVGTISTSGFVNAAGNPLTAIPSGTVMIFAQTTAPTGWTKSTAHNDKALRVVSGTASSGGSTAFTSVFAARTIQQANLPNETLTGTTSTGGAHTHTVAATFSSAFRLDGGNSGYYQQGSGNSSFSTSSSGSHSHTFTTSSINGGVTQTAVDFAVQYVDVILAAKD